MFGCQKWLRSAAAASAGTSFILSALPTGEVPRRATLHSSNPRHFIAACQQQPQPQLERRDPLNKLGEAILTPAVQYAELHGLLYAAKDTSSDPSLATQCPVALLPFQIPKETFDSCVALGPLWGKLVDAIARDRTWLYETLHHAAQVDPFTAELVRISKAVHAEEGGLRQKMMLGIHRSDYMLHEPDATTTPRLLQVELNTIASSMLSHASNIEQLHRFLLGRFGSTKGELASALEDQFGCKADELLEHLPVNRSLVEVPAAIAKAHQAYGAPGAVVVMVVQASERNFADQRWIEYALWEQHKVPILRRTMEEIHKEGVLDGSGKLVLGKGSGPEVSVVYFRAGYDPDEYSQPEVCESRLLIEKSMAIKCPSIDYQLVGAKKVQQALAKPGALERFLSPEECEKLRTCFAGLWGLGVGEDDAEIIQEVFKAPQGFVLKPQREGGGHNFYGADVAEQLKTLSVEARGAFILMQRIMPKTQWTIMTREGKCQVCPGLAEFGFYAVYLGDGQSVHLAADAGHLVRTKAEGVDEGGVAAGYAVINSPYLVG